MQILYCIAINIVSGYKPVIWKKCLDLPVWHISLPKQLGKSEKIPCVRCVTWGLLVSAPYKNDACFTWSFAFGLRSRETVQVTLWRSVVRAPAWYLGGTVSVSSQRLAVLVKTHHSSWAIALPIGLNVVLEWLTPLLIWAVPGSIIVPGCSDWGFRGFLKSLQANTGLIP
jgi:hypothetical protein